MSYIPKVETCILSSVKQIASPGWMHETSAQDGEFHNLGQVIFNLIILNFTFWKDYFTIEE